MKMRYHWYICRFLFVPCCAILVRVSVFAQDTLSSLERIEPSNWWVGMSYDNVQLIVHGKDISHRKVAIAYKGVILKETHQVENPNYLFLDVQVLPSAKSGTFPIVFSSKGQEDLSYTFELKERNKKPRAQGITSSDFIYLLMPDRFANGDMSNDTVAGMNEMGIDRSVVTARHGGDLQGVIRHLDYLQQLGITALWLTPVLENNEKSTSYHGYANTENYRIDRRYGTNELFRALTDSLHQRGMKMIMDIVPNHFGDRHWTMVDMPMKDWVHQWPSYTNSNFRDQAVFDPYAAASDKERMANGWFDTHMPDMNQSNPYVQKYITQSNIWWIEYAGIDGFRIDTYPYNDPAFMSDWALQLKKEYPHLSLFGETWVHGVVNQAAFTEGNTINRGIDTHLPGVTDFQMLWAITDALTKPSGWDDGLVKIYTTLSNDFVYKKPSNNVVFLDNHDLSRFYSVVDQNADKLKSAIALLLTTRGIPQMYYGTEILLKGFTNPDGLVREDFPGGWQGDKENKFVSSGRSQAENEMVDYISSLAHYRKKNPVLQTGKLMQYIPENGVYVYFRYNDDKTVMVVMNTGNKSAAVDLQRYEQRIKGFSKGYNIVTKSEVKDLTSISVPSYSTIIIELMK